MDHLLYIAMSGAKESMNSLAVRSNNLANAVTPLIMVFLDSAGKFSRLGDAERVRRWVESNPALAAPLQAARSTNG